MLDFWTARDITEGDADIHNPLSHEKPDLVTRALGLADGLRVLDVGCGNGWYLAHLASRWRLDASGVDANQHFVRRAQARPVDGGATVRFVEAMAQDHAVPPGSLDRFVCLGATFALGGFAQTLEVAAASLRPGGLAAVGDLYRDPTDEIPDGSMLGVPETLGDQAAHAADAGLDVVAVVASSTDDWDRFQSRIWQAAAHRADAHPDDPRTPELLAETAASRTDYLTASRPVARWAVLVLRRAV